jgi:hypothetical protein
MEVKRPSKQSHETLAKLVSEVLLIAILKHHFGFKTDEEKDMDDNIIAMEEETQTVWFDHILDDLPCPSAPYFRLERIWNWCLHYEQRTWARIICEDCELGGAGLFCQEEKLKVRNAFMDRLAALPAFNRTSYGDFREQQHEGFESESDDDLQENNNGAYTGKPGWELADWWTNHPMGIPRKSSLSYEACMESYSDIVLYRGMLAELGPGHPRVVYFFG